MEISEEAPVQSRRQVEEEVIYQSHAVSHETQGEGLTRRGVEGEHVERTRAGDDCEGAEGVTCLRQGSQNCPARSRDLDRVSLAQF